MGGRQNVTLWFSRTRRSLMVCVAIAATGSGAPIMAHVSQGKARRSRAPSGFLQAVSAASDKAGDEIEIFHALKAGDATRVHQLADKLKLNGITRNVLNAQLDYDMVRLLAAARTLRDKSFKRGLLSAATWSGAIAEGAAMQLGNAKAIFQALAWEKRVGLPAQAAKTGMQPARLDGGYDSVDLTKLAHSVPAPTIKIDADHASIPVVEWTAHQSTATKEPVTEWTSPSVDIRVNGHQIEAGVDTGTPASLILDVSHARGLGIKTLVRGLTALPSLDHPQFKAGNATLGLVKKFRFGPLTLRNLAVKVVPDGYAGDGVLVGLSVLTRFKQVTFTGSHIVVSTKATACPSALPQTYAATDSLEIGHLGFPATANGTAVRAVFDSGSTVLLTASPSLNRSRRRASSNSGVAHRRGYLAVSVGKGQVSSYDTAFLSRLQGPPSKVLIGTPVLATAKVTLTFSPPSLCVTSKHSSRVGS